MGWAWYNMPMDAYTELALQSINGYLLTGTVLRVPAGTPAGMLQRKSGVFVTLHLHHSHQLRGCIGTLEPTKRSIAEEIISNALSAAFNDPRFPPVNSSEVPGLDVHVDVLSAPQLVRRLEDLDPIRYGLIVTNHDGCRGVLLPDIGVTDVAEQVRICCEKGGIDQQRDQLTYQRFTVTRHTS
jgi:AmmeMemoRadiSam system protein A